MTISPIGNIGISNEEPQELVHIKEYLTIHSNSTYSFFALNMKYDIGQKKPINAANNVSALEFKNAGDVYLYSAGNSGSIVNYYETNGGLKGIHLKNNENSKTEIGMGREVKSQTRLAIKGLSSNSTSNALRVENSNSQVSFIIKDNGAVGIGTEEPKTIFQIGQEFLFSHGATNSPKFFDINGYWDNNLGYNRSVTNGPSLRIGTDGNQGQMSAFIMIDYKETPGSKIYYFTDPNDSEINYGWDHQNGKYYKGLKIMNDGKIGIGVWNPYSALTVRSKGNTEATSAFDVRDTDDALLFMVRDNGNVGIGVDDPLEKLVVDGTICAKEVRVSLEGDPSWPDYVFDENYNLTNITELEKYIKENKKLPEMPSANEVSDQGIEIGEMQARMLKKIEELTLYVIELKKEIQELKKR